jgi:DNA-binding HxlR family transcriptional regulator
MAVSEQLRSAYRIFAEDRCESRPIMSQVTNRWGALIIAALVDEPHRFSALRHRVEGISPKVLSQNLKSLVRAGLVDRVVEPTVPPQVTYSLTELGESLAESLQGLFGWFGAHSDTMIAAQRGHDDRARERPGDRS